MNMFIILLSVDAAANNCRDLQKFASLKWNVITPFALSPPILFSNCSNLFFFFLDCKLEGRCLASALKAYLEQIKDFSATDR